MPLRTWLGFFAACWLISLSPGPGAISCLSAGLRSPYRTAVWNVAGLIAGILTLVSVVAAGIGALLAASLVAFTAVKWLGAGYLVYLGVQQWRAPVRPVDAEAPAPGEVTPRALFLRGYLVNVTNPKGIVFLLAVLPQFIDPVRSTPAQYAVSGLTLAFTDFVVMSGYTAVAGNLLRWLRSERHVRWLNRCFGGLFAAAGVGLAVWRRA